MPKKNVVIVMPTSDAEAARSVVTSGDDGVYMLVANGGTALWSAKVRINAVVTAGGPAARPSDARAGTGTDLSPRAAISTPATLPYRALMLELVMLGRTHDQRSRWPLPTSPRRLARAT
jgi:hypothetical protein